ncbi:E3 ubiquitin/ISG15 ligase TRIM25-like [Engystomops pustulosus]|uniref:E3 ubiquitin/ISG15 ligase TRIM25-like n=1 Tax=Engystomops pustulosus TaxID=76066 RepID=UPI003AFA5FF1
MASAVLRKELECSICLKLYTDPVTLRCGHNFCRICIDQVLNRQDEAEDYSCPECRAEFHERPALIKNITLCNIVKNFLSAHRDDALIFCTYCVDSPVPAAKSCLRCEASLCNKHLRVHSKGPEHVLTDPSTSLENRKCSVHKKILEYYCTEDEACICVSCCLIGKHRGHKLESLNEASEKKKKTLKNVLQKIITKRKETEERVQSLKKRKRKAQDKACGEANRVNALYTDMRRGLDDLEKKKQLDKLEKRVLSKISKQDKQASLSLSDVIQKLEIEKDELSRKMKDIEELCNMTDPLTVLQEPDTGDLCDPEEEAVNVTFYVQDPADILLDIHTAARNIVISDDRKTATWVDKKQNPPETAERFQYNQVMSSEVFHSGRHYWDAEIGGSGLWSIGMCYPSIDRTGCESRIGVNVKSWCLHGGQWLNNQYSVRYNCNAIYLPHQISSDKVRVYLDYDAGQMSFYELCDPIKHIYTFIATFTEPLHAVLGVYNGYIKVLGGSKGKSQTGEDSS